MKNKRILFYISLILVLLLATPMLSGCQLAIETYGPVDKADKMSGLYITLGQQNIPFDLGEMEAIVSEDGYSIKFDGFEGYYLGQVYNNNNDFGTYVGEAGLYDSKSGVSETDEGVIHYGEATLYLSKDYFDIVTINAYPVYFRPDGTYYTVPAAAEVTSFQDATGNAYPSSSITQENSYSSTINGKKTTRTDSYKINITVADAAEQIFIKEMNQADELVKTTEYFIDSPPDFVVEDTTEYVIVEELMNHKITGPYIKRSVYSLDKVNSTDSIVCHYCHFSGESGIIGLTGINFKKD